MRKIGLVESLTYGLAVAVIFGGIASVVYVLGGAQELRNVGLGLAEVLTIYALGGAAGGFLFWFAHPLGTTKIGGAIVGFLCLLPVGLGVAVLISPDEYSATIRYVGAVVVSAIIGGAIGFSEAEK